MWVENCNLFEYAIICDLDVQYSTILRYTCIIVTELRHMPFQETRPIPKKFYLVYL